MVGGRAVVDTLSALLVWEPKRITPIYAVSEGDLRAELAPPGQQAGDVPEHGFRVSREGPRALDPRTGFGRHTAAGEELDVVTEVRHALADRGRVGRVARSGRDVRDAVVASPRAHAEPVCSPLRRVEPGHRCPRWAVSGKSRIGPRSVTGGPGPGNDGGLGRRGRADGWASGGVDRARA